MKISKKLLATLTGLSILFSLTNCSDDDNSPQLETWEIEINQVEEATAKYIDYSEAQNEGRFDVSGYVPNMGHHYLNPALIDGTFDLLQPEFILYKPDAAGNMQMMGIEYGVIPDDPNNPGTPPEGFTGDADVWHFNDMVGQWQLHVWTVLENPDGVFASHNTAIGD
ncbi:MAG: hypothetical protein WA775_06075 [Psychroserpens sp.]|uniref:hypothetical protein n=1 Tax=Psychroserpens sp. TaxID=2020870 RepID=UPI003C730BEC